jgi:hypothetical protein
MKKILVSIFAVFYLASSVGTTVHLHYCMNKLINWSLLNGGGDKCDKCGMEKDGGCCKDDQKFVKNSIDQKVTESSIEVIKFAPATSPVAFVSISEFYSSIVHEYTITHAPPESGGEIYIRNCVFRI